MRSAVGDAREADRVGTAGTSVERVRGLVHECEVAVTRRLRNHRLTRIDSWPLELALVDEALHRSCVATHVPDCGETAQQHATSFGNRVAEEQTGRAHHEVQIVVRISHQMDVSVCESWHQKPSATVDDSRWSSRRLTNGRVRNGTDPRSIDDHVGILSYRIADSIKHIDIANNGPH